MLRLQKLTWSSVGVECDVVVSFDRQAGAWLDPSASDKLEERNLNLEDVTKGGCRSAVTDLTIVVRHGAPTPSGLAILTQLHLPT
jgi:hypothetical protein